MANHRRDACALEVGGDVDGGIGVGKIVADEELDRAAIDAAFRVDLPGGQLGRQLHGQPDWIAEGTGDADANRLRGSLPATEGGERGREREHAGRPPE